MRKRKNNRQVLNFCTHLKSAKSRERQLQILLFPLPIHQDDKERYSGESVLKIVFFCSPLRHSLSSCLSVSQRADHDHSLWLSVLLRTLETRDGTSVEYGSESEFLPTMSCNFEFGGHTVVPLRAKRRVSFYLFACGPWSQPANQRVLHGDSSGSS